MSRSLVIATLAALATAFIALKGMHEPLAQANAAEPAAQAAVF